ncbi:YfhD family protein [Alkalihalobacillus sp. LMS39]|uniref:YfhD family protein n=1 Tax=Alkalihalobacillus sp. LMS39 TaxID=2924032 RepID=UPI001FB26304|nr:YfhD family protein [Alkalihalobacillus sp. LMS39]UOE94935.1 YfhD family protein [Alkalihalobacillus sp. LMS39]
MDKKKNKKEAPAIQGAYDEVEYSAELADADDIEANERAAAADRRAQNRKDS